MTCLVIQKKFLALKPKYVQTNTLVISVVLQLRFSLTSLFILQWYWFAKEEPFGWLVLIFQLHYQEPSFFLLFVPISRYKIQEQLQQIQSNCTRRKKIISKMLQFLFLNSLEEHTKTSSYSISPYRLERIYTCQDKEHHQGK